jgi:predicted nucleic acid-binding protein
VTAAPFVLDTSVYIRAFRDPDAEARLQRFLWRRGHRVLFASTVAMELRVGARTPPVAAAIDALLAAYRSRGHVIAPSFDAHVEAGRALASLAAKERRSDVATARLTNDALLASTCREAEATLVTSNLRDFVALRRHLRGFQVRPADDLM